jgi:hypothetical protein
MRDAGTIVADLDTDFCSTPAAPDHDMTAGLGALERIAREISHLPSRIAALLTIV